MAFDPDAYLSSKSSNSFDPDAYLTQQDKPSMMSRVGTAAKEVFTKPTDYAADLATNPISMAKALPPLLGTAGAISPIPMGATLGTIGGRQLSNEALHLLGKSDQIPSTQSQVREGGLALLGDTLAIPAVKRSIFGSQVGEAEKAAGVITRAPDKLPTAGNVGETLNTLESQLTNGTITDPQTARDAYAITRYINSNPNLVGKSSEISVQAARVGKLAQETLNNLVPDRMGPAMALKGAMVVPNAIENRLESIPPWLRKGILLGLGFSGVKKGVELLGK